MTSTTRPVKPLAVYTRVSQQGRRDDVELLSHDLQRERIAGYAEAHGYTLALERFEDTDRSGTSMDRPAFNAAVAGVLGGEYGGLVVARLSRFARTVMGGLKAIQEIERAGGAFVCIDPPIDTATASGRFVLTIFLALYAMEAEAIGEGTKHVLDTKTKEGILVATYAPAGYEFEVLGRTRRGKPIRGRLVANEHAPAIRAAFELKAAGGSWAEVARLLAEAGVPTIRGHARWSKMAARSLIENPVYLGTVRNGGREKLNAHEAIVPGWVWRKAQPGTRAPYSRGEGHVLGEGLVRCQTCDAGLAKSRAGNGCLTLRCPTPGKGHASISYRPAEDWILGVVFAHVVGWTVERSGGNAAEVEAAEARVAAAHEALAEVEAIRGSVKPAAFAVALSDAQAELEAAEDARAALILDAEEVNFLTPLGNREKFEVLPVPERRRLLRKLVSRVVVKPGRAHLSDRIEITFADGSLYPPPFDPTTVPAIAAPDAPAAAAV